MRELVLLLVMAFWQEDDEFLAEVVLQLADQELPDDFDLDAFQAEIARARAERARPVAAGDPARADPPGDHARSRPAATSACRPSWR